MSEIPFWQAKSLEELSHGEWESLCDGCGRCCLIKLEDEDGGGIFLTNLACKLLDTRSCQCTDYPGRRRQVPDCIQLTPVDVDTIPWLPDTCAYRLIREGKPLFDWHPLISGRPESVHEAGVSVSGKVLSEAGIAEDEFEDHILGRLGLGRLE